MYENTCRDLKCGLLLTQRKALEVQWNGMQRNGLSENETETELFV